MSARNWLSTAILVALTSAAFGQDAPPATTGDPLTDELIEQERIRSAVDEIFETYFEQAPDGDVRVDKAINAAKAFAGLGQEAVPYLVNELDQERLGTYDLCSYALGIIGTTEAIEALHATAVGADAEPGAPSRSVKTWAVWGLGLAGQVDAIRLMVGGRHEIFRHPIHNQMSILESAALQTAPESVEVLLEILDETKDDAEQQSLLRVTLRALRRVGDPRAVRKVLALLKHDDFRVRRGAASTLRSMPSPKVVKALISALADEERTVRQNASHSLQFISPSDQTELLLERLATEDDPITRGNLYRLLAETAGPEVFDRLIRFTRLPDRRDRLRLLEALERIDDPRRLAALRGAVTDEDNGVATAAIRALGRRRDIEGLTATIPTARLYLVRSAASELARLHAAPAGERIAERLIGALSGADPLSDGDRLALDQIGAALIRLDHVAVIETLRHAEPEQTDKRIREIVARTASRLEIIRANGNEVANWIESSKDPDRDVRRLAWSRLGRIGTPEAVDKMTAAFDGVDTEDRLEILRVVHATPGDRVTELLRRVLLDPEFDHPHRLPLRDMAAWTAARIGGPEMFDLLEQAADRRDGREVRVLLYAALVGGEKAIPLLDRVRLPRMRYLGAGLGLELERLDWVKRRLVAGRSIAELDAPPHIVFR